MANVDVSGQVAFATDPGAYKGWRLGTAAGTTVISSQPGFLSHIQINTKALGTIIIYDSNGTSGSILGSISITSTGGSEPLNTFTYKIATRQGITVSNTANLDLTVAALP